jgi:radical SAM protein with 4Fe4S-binding SPASM domain
MPAWRLRRTPSGRGYPALERRWWPSTWGPPRLRPAALLVGWAATQKANLFGIQDTWDFAVARGSKFVQRILKMTPKRYQLRKAVWEITMACNMRCGHCGSSCFKRLPGELNTEDALHLCDELAELGLEQITLSGGEPLVRKDWYVIAKRLSDHGVTVNIISNGWLVDDLTITRARTAGLSNIAMSLDGLEKTHDSIRQNGAFARVVRALKLMREKDFPSAIVTTVMRRNLSELAALRGVLEDYGVECWQLQIGLPMGNLQRSETIAPSQVNEVIDLIHSLLRDSTIKPFPADSIGYCTSKIGEVWEDICSGCRWRGCQAGKSSLGILHDGRIVGCTSVRQEGMVEGSVRETSLHTIWNRPGAFAWNRGFTKNDLAGFCETCQFGERCLGGCANTRLTMSGNLRENPYCAYRVMIEHDLFPKIDAIHSVEKLRERAQNARDLRLYEVAERCLARAEALEAEGTEP